MKRFLAAITLLVSLHNYAQRNFEKGYFIDNKNVKTECFIKDSDWKENPEKFKYKASENEASIYEKGVNDVKEFGVGEFDKFERFEGLIDDSSNNISQLSNKREPSWIKRTIFLKVIIQGNASLYRYTDGNTTKYFYSYNGSPVEQLVYKKYAEDNVSVMENNFFQRQLYTKVKSATTTMDQVMKIKYTEENLSAYFLEVNNSGVDKKDIVDTNVNKNSTVDRRGKIAKDNLLLRLKGGVGFNSLDISYVNPDTYNPDFKFDGGQTYKLGLDVEYVFPTNKNKWSVFFEAAYKSKYESNKKVLVGDYPFTDENTWSISYSSFDLGLGLRHYMFLNNNSKLFLNVSAMYSPILDAKLQKNGKDELKLDSMPYVGLGFGYGYKRYSIEFRYCNRTILGNYYYISSKYKDLSVVLGYTLFESNKKK